MPKVSEEHLVAKQEQILEAAVRCFARSGFHATGMAEIIRESGLSAGSVYRYYKSKDDLIAVIIGRMMGMLDQQIMQATAGAVTPGEVVSRCVRFASEKLSEDESNFTHVLPQVWTEALRNPLVASLVSEKYDQIIAHFETLIVQMQREGQLDARLDPAGVAHVMLSVVQGFMLQRLLLNRNVDAATYIATSARLLFGGLPESAQVRES